MQSKIIEYASDRLTNALHKIDKKDVQKVMTNISGKLQSKNQQTTSKSEVTSSEEYCAMLKNEFVFTQSKKGEKSDAVVRIDAVDAKKRGNK
jgi:hypothetical protein